MSRFFGKKSVFAACVRDCAPVLPQVLENISRISRLFDESAFIFVENDSVDATKDMLRDWCKSRPNARVITLDGLAISCSVRTLRLAIARNHFLSVARMEYPAYDYYFVLDADDVTAEEIDLDAAGRAVEFLESDTSHAGVSANSMPVYYDLWTLRHPQRWPDDFWERICEEAASGRLSDEEAVTRFLIDRAFTIAPGTPPIAVDSAFNGFAIYKMSSVLRNRRNYFGYKLKQIMTPHGIVDAGFQCCEHVAFNAGFRDLGEKLFILPDLVTFTQALLPSLELAAVWKSLVFRPETLPEKIASNDLCPCGSGHRYKNCHGKLV